MKVDDFEAMNGELNGTIVSHFEWLGSIGIECNFSKTELISFGR